MYTLVLIRHGESQWNLENRFTGWTNVDLSDKGVEEAKNGGELLKAEGYSFDLAYTSYLLRAQHTLDLVLESMGIKGLPITKSWELNERHYGALQGLNKAETAAKYGDDQVLVWRRSYDIQPPALEITDERNPALQDLYKDVAPENLPLTESLKDTVARAVPYYNEEILPKLKAGKKVVIAGHGNSLRAQVKYFDNLSEEEITGVNIPTGVPLVYKFDDNDKVVEKFYLGDQDAIAAKMNAVANQGKAK